MNEINKEIEEILRILNEDCGECKTCGYCGLGYACTDVANSIKLYNAGYRKIDKDSVVLSREDMKKYAEDCIAGQETGLDIINALIARAERYKEKAKQTRQETAREIIEKLLSKVEQEQWSDSEISCVYKLVYADEIEDLAKEYGVEL